MSEGENNVMTLQEFVRARLYALGDEDGPLSLERAADKSRGRVSAENIRRMLRGEHGGKLRDSTVEGLAMALDVPVAEVYRVVGAQRPGRRWVMPERFDRLTTEERRRVEEVALAILNAYNRGFREGRTGSAS